MSSTDETLKNYFINSFKRGNEQDNVNGNITDVLDWLRSLNIPEKLDVNEADIDKAFKIIAEKASTVDPDKFLEIIEQLSKTTKIEVNKFKENMLEQIELADLEKQFKVKLAAGKACLKDLNDWLNRNDVLNKAQLKKEEVSELLNKLKDDTAIDFHEFSQAMKKLADRSKVNLSGLIKTITDPGFLPLASTSDEKKGN